MAVAMMPRSTTASVSTRSSGCGEPACSSGRAGLSSTTPGSLLFDLEVEEASKDPSCHGGGLERMLVLTERLQYLLGPQSLTESRLIRDVRVYKRQAVREETGVDGLAVDLAASLAAVGWRVNIRTAIGGGSGTACFQNLSHSFLVVSNPAIGGSEFIVEPNFREHFRIPHPTELYVGLLSLVPEEFVGTAGRLVPLVQLLCDEMRAAFAAQGLACPPWRQLKPVLSKWLPSRCTDVAAKPAAPGSPGAAAPSELPSAASFAAGSGTVAAHSRKSPPGGYRPCTRRSLLSGWFGDVALQGGACQIVRGWTSPRRA